MNARQKIWVKPKVISVSGRTLLVSRLFGANKWAVLLVMAVSANTAVAKTPLPISLDLTAPSVAQLQQPQDITLQLVNKGNAAPDSRMRLFIHDGDNRDLNLNAIEISVQQGGTWTKMPLEAVDGGFMAAIGAENTTHAEHHRRGGFAIAKHANKVWRLRITFRQAGRYSFVSALSPNNGGTHLAQPQSVTIEAL